MFKSRSGTQGSPAAAPPQSIEAVRRRARHRLIGASVLVLLGVLGFPLLFDTQPRPISVDVPIEIPAKNTAPALAASKKAPSPVTASAPEPKVEAAPAASAERTSTALPTQDSLGAREEIVEPARAVAASEPPAPATPAARPEPAAPKPPAPAASAKVASTTASTADASRAKALLEGKPASPTDEAGERIVVQVGAFADAARAREVRLKVESAGLKTYTHVAQTAEGSRIRVRVGPFKTRAEAEKAAARVKSLGLPAGILTL